MKIYRTDNNWKTIQDHLVTSEGKIMTAENVPSTPLVTKIRKNSQTYSKSNAKKAKTASKKIMKYVRKGKKIQEKPKQLQEELPITPQAPKAPASELSVVEDIKKDVKQQGGIEILDEVSTILSARRAKIAARKKFIRTELTPTAQPDKVTVDEKKDDMRPWLETVTETPKIRFKVNGRKIFLLIHYVFLLSHVPLCTSVVNRGLQKITLCSNSATLKRYNAVSCYLTALCTKDVSRNNSAVCSSSSTL
jgi:hypothetical protein